MSSKKKPLFHSPQKTGELRRIPMSLPVKILSVGALVLLAGLTIFAIYAAVQNSGEQVVLSEGFYMSAGLLYLFLPIVGWIIALGFRIALKVIPIEMWRLPSNVKYAAIKSEGRYLKIATLLTELETTLAFIYITISLYNGQTPGDIPILIWVAAVAATIVGFGMLDVKKASKA